VSQCGSQEKERWFTLLPLYAHASYRLLPNTKSPVIFTEIGAVFPLEDRDEITKASPGVLASMGLDYKISINTRLNFLVRLAYQYKEVRLEREMFSWGFRSDFGNPQNNTQTIIHRMHRMNAMIGLSF